MLITAFVFMLSVGYGALNEDLTISGEAHFRVEADIRITDVSLYTTTYSALEDYNPSFGKNSTKVGITLPSNSSSVTYKVTVTNYGNTTMELKTIEKEIVNNNYNITFNKTLPLTIGKLSSEEIEITFSNNTNTSQTINASLLFTFAKEEAVMASGNSGAATSAFYNGPLTKDSIESITFMSTKEIPEDAIGYWDASAVQGTNKVMAYYLDEDENSLYELYITADGEVYAPSSSDYLFARFNNVTSINFNNSFNTEKSTNMVSMFSNCSSLTSLDLSSFNTENVTSMSFMFMNLSKLEELDVSNFNTLKVTTLVNTFVGCKALKELNLNSWHTPNLTSQYNAGNGLFTGCSALKVLKIDNFDTSKMNNMRQMFQSCTSLISLNVSSFNTSNVTDMMYMFRGCKALTELNLANFDTSKVTSISGMFGSCSQLKSIDLSNFNTEKVTSMTNLFQLCTSIKKINVIGWNTKKVTSMSGMFSYCSALEEIEGLGYFDIDSATTLSQMFTRSPKLTVIDISGMDFENKNVTTTDMFGSTPSGSTIYVKNEYNKTFIEDLASNANVIIYVPPEEEEVEEG